MLVIRLILQQESGNTKVLVIMKREKGIIAVYEFIRKNGGWDNWDMILIETIKCENNLEARKKEREHLEQLGATLNKERP